MICDKCGQNLPGVCAGCGNPVAKGKYCSGACKIRAHRNKHVTKVTQNSKIVTKVTSSPETVTNVTHPPAIKKAPKDSKKPFVNRLKSQWKPK